MEKLVVSVDESHGAGKDAPGNHDAGDPYPRADLLHDHIARHLEDEVAEKERSERKSEVGRGQLEIAAHGQAAKLTLMRSM